MFVLKTEDEFIFADCKSKGLVMHIDPARRKKFKHRRTNIKKRYGKLLYKCKHLPKISMNL